MIYETLFKRLLNIGNPPKPDEDLEMIDKKVFVHMCKCGCPVFDKEKQCPDCSRVNPIFDNSY